MAIASVFPSARRRTAITWRGVAASEVTSAPRSSASGVAVPWGHAQDGGVHGAAVRGAMAAQRHEHRGAVGGDQLVVLSDGSRWSGSMAVARVWTGMKRHASVCSGSSSALIRS